MIAFSSATPLRRLPQTFMKLIFHFVSQDIERSYTPRCNATSRALLIQSVPCLMVLAPRIETILYQIVFTNLLADIFLLYCFEVVRFFYLLQVTVLAIISKIELQITVLSHTCARAQTYALV